MSRTKNERKKSDKKLLEPNLLKKQNSRKDLILAFDFSKIDESITSTTEQSHSKLVESLYKKDLLDIDHKFEGAIHSENFEAKPNLEINSLKRKIRTSSLTLWDLRSKFDESIDKNNYEIEDKEEKKIHIQNKPQTEKTIRKDRAKSLTLFDSPVKENKKSYKNIKKIKMMKVHTQ